MLCDTCYWFKEKISYASYACPRSRIRIKCIVKGSTHSRSIKCNKFKMGKMKGEIHR